MHSPTGKADAMRTAATGGIGWDFGRVGSKHEEKR
jgi:hypothetical protein